MFSIQVNETNDSFKQKVLLAICEELTLKFFLISKRVRDDVARDIKSLFKNTKEYQMMTSDANTIADFGFRVGTQINKLNAIIDKISENIYVSFTPFTPKKNSISGGITLGILIKDFSDLFDLPEAKTKGEDGYVMEWLRWLLERGDSIIIDNYHVEYGPFGRSHEGHMIIGGVWKVSSLISGTMKNNWLTRALTDSDEHARTALKDIITNSVALHLK